MKPDKKRLFGTAALMTALAAVTATAGIAFAKPIDRDADAPQPNAVHKAQAGEAGPVKQAPAPAYLGVAVKPLGPATTERLGLAADTGLRLMQVAPDSPAERAGLKPGDVLTHLNDQLLINAQQFTVLIRTLKPGDEAKLRLVREGEAVTLKARLGERALPAPPAQGHAPIEPNIQPRIELPEQLLPRLIAPDLMDPMPAPDRLDGPIAMQDFFEQMHQRMNQQRNEMQQMFEQLRRQMRIDQDAWRELPKMEHGSAVRSNIIINDGEHTLQLKSDGQSRHLTVKTAKGEVLFDGELPENGQIEGLPDGVQQKIDNLLKKNRIEWRIKPAPHRVAEPDGPVA